MNQNYLFRNAVGLALLFVMSECSCSSAEELNRTPGDSIKVEANVEVDEPKLTESSGLAASRIRVGHFWSHNDSGGQPRLFAFNANGKSTGGVKLKSARAKDWEDLAAYTDHVVPRLVAADCGDNLAQRDEITLYAFDEPDPEKKTVNDDYQTWIITYPDGPRNCEAIAVDSQRRRLYLVTKTTLPFANVYQLDLPDRGQRKARIEARIVKTLPLPMATTMDLDEANGDIWIANYFQAFCFHRTSLDQELTKQLSQTPTVVAMPRWKQIEAIAVDGFHNVWVTSEGSPTPLGRLPIADGPTSESKRKTEK